MIYGAYTCWMRAACASVPRRNFPPCRHIWPHFRQWRCRYYSHKTRVSTTRQESNWRGFCPVQTVNNSSSSRPAHDVFIYLDFYFYASFLISTIVIWMQGQWSVRQISDPRKRRFHFCRFKLNVLISGTVRVLNIIIHHILYVLMKIRTEDTVFRRVLLFLLEKLPYKD